MALSTISEDLKRKTPAQLRHEVEDLRAELIKLKSGAYCYMCDTFKPKSDFYMNKDPMIKSQITCICKKCAAKIACPIDENAPYGTPGAPTKATVMNALERLDKPFINTIWDASFFESLNKNAGKTKNNIWTSYIKNIAMKDYKFMRWHDGDNFKKGFNYDHLDEVALTSENATPDEQKERSFNDQIQEDFYKNFNDVISQVGYDPFENYPRDEDKPFLYASLNSFIDDETRNDGMKLKAVIQIVKTYNQIEKLNDIIDHYVNEPSSVSENLSAIDKMAASVDKLIRSSAKLAQDNGISVNYNNNKSKGANTLSGKVKQLKEIGLRAAEINTFDIKTCDGMRQVAELSEEARHKQIGYDENIAQEIKDIKVELVETLTKERDAALESLRLLLVENLDLKKSLGIVDGQETKSQPIDNNDSGDVDE